MGHFTCKYSTRQYKRHFLQMKLRFVADRELWIWGKYFSCTFSSYFSDIYTICVCNLLHLCSVLLSDRLVWKLLCCVYMIIFRRLSSVTADLPKIMEIDTPWRAVEHQSNEYQLYFGRRGTGVISFGQIRQQYWIVSYRWQILCVGGTSGTTRQFSGVGSVLQLLIRRACTLVSRIFGP